MSGAPGYFIRPARTADLGGLLALSQLAGPGFTSLQPDPDFLVAMITKSEASFAHPFAGKSQSFLLIMEAAEGGEVVGCASVKTGVGGDEFMCADFEVGGEGGAVRTLTLRRTLQGCIEVGSLFLHPDHRASGAGRFLARARYMLMATRSGLFAGPIVAQLRGWCDQAGRSPFYDAVWLERLGKTYTQTDIRLAREGAGFLIDQFEGMEVRFSELHADAARTIGEPHDTARGALRLLCQEGFHISELVDLSDGGPITMANLDDLTSLHMACPVDLIGGDLPASASPGLVSSRVFDGFYAYVGPTSFEGDEVTLPVSVRDRLKAHDTNGFLASPQRPTRPDVRTTSLEPQQPVT
ncbi:MAG: arginine N-succinyltransferase [Hyphomonadaceae bacterium]|nr:arginine N-succinyltransferase [Hyphomonadaceae bacterium]